MRACNQVTVQIGQATRPAHPRLRSLAPNGVQPGSEAEVFPEQACERGGCEEGGGERKPSDNRLPDLEPHSSGLSPGHPKPRASLTHRGVGGRRRELRFLAALSAPVEQDHVAEQRRAAWGRTPTFLRAGSPPSQHELHRRLRAFGENTE